MIFLCEKLNNEINNKKIIYELIIKKKMGIVYKIFVFIRIFIFIKKFK